MEVKIKELIEKHKDDKDLTGEIDQIIPGMDWSEADLRGYDLSGLQLSNLRKKADFHNTNLTDANLRGVLLTGANLRNSRLIKAKLQKALLIKADLQKASLNYAYLQETNLIEADFKKAMMMKTSLQRADLMEADLSGAILIGANLRFASLVGTILNGASLVRANLREADFNEKTQLKNVNLYQSKLMGSTLKNAYQNMDPIIIQERNKKYAIARDIYMNLKTYFNQEGMYDIAGEYYYREKLMETHCICSKRKYSRWLFNHFLNITAGFGEKPIRVLFWWIVIIMGFALIYFNGQGLMISGENMVHAETFWECLYFSIVTFTTLGFGDIAPKPGFRLFASVEALLGAILMAMFIYVFSRKMGR